MTMDDLALIVAEGFKESEKLMDKKLEKLATSTQKEFLELGENIKNLENDIKGIKKDIKAVKSDTEDIKVDLNKKVDVFTHNDLKFRVEKSEKNYA